MIMIMTLSWMTLNPIASPPYPLNFRYVDDIITAAPHNKIDIIKNTFNNFNHKIQFTTEEESEGRISFLDVLIIRAGDGIKTNWYVINNLVDRCISLSHRLP